MKKRTKAVLTIFFLSLLFFVEINVEARSVRNMSAYPAKHGQSFVQSVWMEQKESLMPACTGRYSVPKI